MISNHYALLIYCCSLTLKRKGCEISNKRIMTSMKTFQSLDWLTEMLTMRLVEWLVASEVKGASMCSEIRWGSEVSRGSGGMKCTYWGREHVFIQVAHAMKYAAHVSYD